MKKTLAVLFAAMLLCSVCPLFSFAGFNEIEEATKGLASDIYYMISLDENSELFSKNETKRTAPAAFVKLLAAIVAIEKWDNLDETVAVTQESLSLVQYEYGVRTAGMHAGDTYTRRQLIDTLVIYSANDAASIIAYSISGSAEAFVQLMNETAQKIGCTDTRVVNITGFDAKDQYTTAKDVAAIVRYGNQQPVFAQAFSAMSITLPETNYIAERTYNADNKMRVAAVSDYYHASVNGGKATSTTEAGECIAVTTSQDGYAYICVVMKGSLADIDKDGVNENTALTDAKQLIAWTYSNVRYRVIATQTQTVQVVNVTAARDGDTLRLVPEKETSALVPSKASSTSVLIKPIEETMPEKLTAPIKQGDVICQAQVIYGEQVITTINLVAASDVRLSMVRLFMTNLRRVLSSTAFILLEIAGLIVLILYIVMMILKYKKAKEARKPKLQRVEGGRQNRR